MTAWIRMIDEAEAPPALQPYYDQARGPSGKVDNVMKVHSLRPHTMAGHVAIYRSVLHDEGNTLPDWLLETIASYTSMLNDCPYSLANHFANASHLMSDPLRAEAVRAALAADRPEDAFAGKELAFLRYARKLTLEPQKMIQADVEALRTAGAEDGEILEVNQVCCYFNYVNRLLNGLGVTLEGDLVGFYGHEAGDDR